MNEATMKIERITPSKRRKPFERYLRFCDKCAGLFYATSKYSQVCDKCNKRYKKGGKYK